ncbi:methionyl-tRNA synthetase [Lentisphaera araneosa HTCC2155]|uniref:Methionine--tRNA ligase n=1 Tax=Lentisphaera araneosa HTCC2155 TaxID=313628 RepID=A6DMJ3_9BACT|nr:methionine--tRNA ligase [Lentisphaera araneosa]EDM27183.1 methionyl-tRNA synthetase [Lentisphaera araneosa HTCC2155]
MSKKRLITSALPYVNNEPHLGNLIGCVLSADCFARFSRSCDYETLYICGTDEYGTATETKAAQEGLSPREICDKYHVIHKKIYDHFNICFDAFGRTSTDIHTQTVQEIFEQVAKEDHFKVVENEQFYSESMNKFLADRLINGTCPKCGYDDARGDQCDGCGALLTPTELIDPKCSVDKSTPVLRKTKHLHLKLPELSSDLEAWQNHSIEAGHWPNNADTTTRSWMKRGLESRAITRDLKWGVPVPYEGFTDKVFYVWFDAPIGYVSITRGAFPDTWKYWWHDPDNTQLFQFMAKDNIPFHSVIFPATQIASGDKWTMCHHLASTEYLNYEDTKFSKSRNIGVFGSDVIESGIDVDLWRFYLLAIRPEKQDSAFTWQEFFDKVNNEFLDNIGNLVNRSLVYANKNFSGPIELCEATETQTEFKNKAQELIKEITQAYEACSFREAIRLTLILGKLGNKFFQDEEPWVKIKEGKDEEVRSAINILVHLVRDISILLSPAMPNTANKIQSFIGLKDLKWNQLGDFSSLVDQEVTKPSILFPKLDTSRVEKLRSKFSGETDAFEKLDLRVGKITSLEIHPEADHLYVLQVDLGEDKPRTICSGLAKQIEKDSLIDKHVVVVSNLAPAELRGVASEGMVLSVAKKKKLEVLDAGNIAPGTCVIRKDDQLQDKAEITIDEFKEVSLRVKDGLAVTDGEALYAEGNELRTTKTLNGKLA